MLFLHLTEFNTRSNRTIDHNSMVTTLKPTEQNWVSNTRHRHQIVHKATQNPKAFTKPLHGQAIKTAQAENHNWVKNFPGSYSAIEPHHIPQRTSYLLNFYLAN